jgi:hypothetical protein
MADMVPISQGRKNSSTVQTKYRVLKKVSRGKYCLIKNITNGNELNGIKNKKKEIPKDDRNMSDKNINKSNYFIHITNDMLEVYSLKRLVHRPKGWQLELKNTIRNYLKLLNGNEISLHALYKSMDTSFFDIENVLFYNIEASAFSHLNIKSLQFERAYEHPTPVNGNDYFEHYQSYKVINDSNILSSHWIRKKILASWESLAIPKLTSETKPHTVWHAMKTGQITIENKINSKYYGLELTIKTPFGSRVNVVSFIKSLLDGIISAFHYHHSQDIEEVIKRLKKNIHLTQKQFEEFLLNRDTAILGPRNLIQPFRDGVKWNPQDDAFQWFKINMESTYSNNWKMDGAIFTMDYINK